MVAGEPRETTKAAGGMSAQRNFLASVLKPGKRQNLAIPQQVIPTAPVKLQTVSMRCFGRTGHIHCCCDACSFGSGAKAHRTSSRHEWARLLGVYMAFCKKKNTFLLGEMDISFCR